MSHLYRHLLNIDIASILTLHRHRHCIDIKIYIDFDVDIDINLNDSARKKTKQKRPCTLGMSILTNFGKIERTYDLPFQGG